MKKTENYNFKIVIITTALTMMALVGMAQKPADQNIPKTIKIDGNAAEWDKHNERFNRNTAVYYTLANDDNNIYLTLTAINKLPISKMILGGVAFSISAASDKKFKNGQTITFPVYVKSIPLYMHLNDIPNTRSDNEAPHDSVMNAYNKQLGIKFKFIGIAGIKEIPDSAISIYNTDNIKVAAKFDKQLHYIYELALPLKYLNLSPDETQIKFNIKLNGGDGINSNVSLVGGRDILVYKGADGINYSMGPGNPQNLNLMIATDFDGQYTLVKK